MKRSVVGVLMIFLVGCAAAHLKQAKLDYERQLEMTTREAEVFKGRSAEVEARWNTFRYNLSNDQVRLLNELVTLGNKESSERFIEALSATQRADLLSLLVDLQDVQKAETRLREQVSALKRYEAVLGAEIADARRREVAEQNALQLWMGLKTVDQLRGINRSLRGIRYGY